MPLDVDFFCLDNSGTRKEGVSYTYHGYFGYAPIAAYLGDEGWCLNLELRAALAGHKKIDYILKWNPRKQDRKDLLERGLQEGKVSTPREGKRVATFSYNQLEEHEGKKFSSRLVIRVTERTIDRRGQRLLLPEIEVEGWWTSLYRPEEEIIKLYHDHGTSEQFHSEFKTDMDLERLPSGKFATNALIMTLAGLTYNILRFIGQLGLAGRPFADPSCPQAPPDSDGDPGTDLPRLPADRNRPPVEA